MSFRVSAVIAIAIAASLACASGARAADSASNAGAPDYSQAADWVCRPGAETACTAGLDATVEGPGVAKHTASFGAAENPKVDCFYVYPTVSQEQTDFSDLADSPEIVDAANRQVGRLASRCRVYAPIYRQLTIAGLTSMMHGANVGFDTSLADVKAAWTYYLAHDNRGRGVVLVGHSQGTIILQQLIASEIDGKPQQKLLVSAFLAGDPSLALPKGKTVGGTFAHVPVCSAIAQTGCAYAWGSYLQGDSSPLFRFGTPLDDGMVSACVNPAAPSGGTGRLKFFHKKLAESSGGDAPFIETVGELTGTCRSDATGSGFIVRVRPGPRAAEYKALLGGYEIFPGWGLHLVDIALVQGNMLDALDAEISTWTRAANRTR